MSQLPRVFLALALVSMMASCFWLLEQRLGPHLMAASLRDFARGMPIVTMMSLQQLPDDSLLAWLAYVLGMGAVIALLFSGLRAIATPARDGSAF
jgi:hypothetical protein